MQDFLAANTRAWHDVGMPASHLRLLLTLLALALAALLFTLLPFGPLARALVAAVVWLVAGALIDRLAFRRMTSGERAAVLRDRTDVPPM